MSDGLRFTRRSRFRLVPTAHPEPRPDDQPRSPLLLPILPHRLRCQGCYAPRAPSPLACGAFLLDILRSRPQIAEDISEVLARRRAELDAAREDLNEEAKRARMRDHQGDLLLRIRNFFAL